MRFDPNEHDHGDLGRLVFWTASSARAASEASTSLGIPIGAAEEEEEWDTADEIITEVGVGWLFSLKLMNLNGS